MMNLFLLGSKDVKKKKKKKQPIKSVRAIQTQSAHFRQYVLSIFMGEGKEMFYFNDALNTFYLWLYGVRYMVKDYSHSERRIPAT